MEQFTWNTVHSKNYVHGLHFVFVLFAWLVTGQVQVTFSNFISLTKIQQSCMRCTFNIQIVPGGMTGREAYQAARLVHFTHSLRITSGTAVVIPVRNLGPDSI